MSFPVFAYEFTVLEKHLDSFGHINNATYLELFEEARWDFITKRGYGLKEIHELKVGPTILDIHIKFKKEILNREKIRVETQIKENRGKVALVHQKMINVKNETACEIDLMIGLFDMKKRRLIGPTPEWLHAIGIQ